MEQIFLAAIEKLSQPIAIVAIVLLFTNTVMVVTILRIMPKIYTALGSLSKSVEFLVYGAQKGGGNHE